MMHERISRGPAFRFYCLLPGILLFFWGIFTSIEYNSGWTWGLPMALAGAMLAADIESVDLHYDEKKLRYYMHFGFFRLLKNTKDISTYPAVTIVYENNLNGVGFRPGGAPASTVVISFEMYLIKKNTLPYFLAEYGSHQEALELAQRMQARMGIEIVDQVTIAIERARLKKRY